MVRRVTDTVEAPAGAYQRAIDGPLRADARFGFKLAYLRCFSAPVVAHMVERHGALLRDPRSRAKRTAELVLAVIHDVDGDRAQQAADALRHAHRNVSADPVDYRYVLACLLTTPIEFVAKAGSRPFTEAEQVDAVRAYRRVGEALGLDGFPTSYDAALEHVRWYERAHGVHTAAGERMVRATIEAYTGPRGLRRALMVWLIRGSFVDGTVGGRLGLHDSSAAGRFLARWAYRTLRRIRGEAL